MSCYMNKSLTKMTLRIRNRHASIQKSIIFKSDISKYTIAKKHARYIVAK